MRGLVDLALLQEARRKELTLPPNPSWQSSDSDENAAVSAKKNIFFVFIHVLTSIRWY